MKNQSILLSIELLRKCKKVLTFSYIVEVLKIQHIVVVYGIKNCLDYFSFGPYIACMRVAPLAHRSLFDIASVEGKMEKSKGSVASMVQVQEVPAFQIGRNMTAEIHGTELVLRINMAGHGIRSKGGEGPNVVIATTSGNVVVPGTDGGRLGLNFYRAV